MGWFKKDKTGSELQIQRELNEALQYGLAKFKLELDATQYQIQLFIAAVTLQNGGELILDDDFLEAVQESQARLMVEHTERGGKPCYRYYLEEAAEEE